MSRSRSDEMGRITAAVHQIDGKLRQNGQKKQAHAIFFLIMGMEEAFHQEKGKHGKCQSADAVSHQASPARVAHR